MKKVSESFCKVTLINLNCLYNIFFWHIIGQPLLQVRGEV